MNRPLLRVVFITGAVVLAAATVLGWRVYAASSRWETLRPAAPSPVGDAAPGMDARLAACAERFHAWPPDRVALAEFAQVCHANGQFEPAAAAYRALMTLEPEEARWPHLLAVILAGEGRLEEALPALRRAAELAPDRVIVWLRLGDALLKSNLTADAEVAFTTALQHSPANPYALLGLGRCDLQSDRWTAARAHLQQAVSAHPEFSAAQSLLATVFDRLGNSESAAVARSRISRDGHFKEPDDPWSDALLGYCHDAYALLVAASAAAAEGNPNQALPLLRHALHLSPNDPRLHRKLGNTLMQLGDIPGARAALEKAVALAPTNDAIQLNLIALLRAAHDPKAAEHAVARGLAACPYSAGLHYEAGRLAEEAGHFEDAAQHFDFTWRNQPDQPATALTLASARFQAHQNELGVSVLERLLSERPDYSPAAAMLVSHGIETGDARTAKWLECASASGLPADALTELQRNFQHRFGATP